MGILNTLEHKDSDLIDLNLRSIHASLEKIEVYATINLVTVRGILLRDLELKSTESLTGEGKYNTSNAISGLTMDAIRACILDIKQGAENLLKMTDLPSNIREEFHLDVLTSLDAVVTNRYKRKHVIDGVNYFTDKIFKVIYPIYTAEFNPNKNAPAIKG